MSPSTPGDDFGACGRSDHPTSTTRPGGPRVRKVVLYTLMSLDGAVDHPEPVLRRRSGARRRPGVRRRDGRQREQDHRGAGRRAARAPHVRRVVAVLAHLGRGAVRRLHQRRQEVRRDVDPADAQLAQRRSGPRDRSTSWSATSRPDPAATSACTAASRWRSRCSRQASSTSCGWWSARWSDATGPPAVHGTLHLRRLELLSAVPTPSSSLLLAYRVL